MAKLATGIDPKVLQYEVFLNDRLKPDLQRSTENKVRLELELQEYDDLEKNLGMLKASDTKQMKVQVDLGSEVFCQAHVPDTSHVFINVGLGFHLQCTLDDAPRVIQLRRHVLQGKIEEATLQNAKIKAHIKLVEAGLRELMRLPGEA